MSKRDGYFKGWKSRKKVEKNRNKSNALKDNLSTEKCSCYQKLVPYGTGICLNCNKPI